MTTGKIQGLQATGQPIDVPVAVAGSDGGTKRALAVDASGRVIGAGAAAAGAAAAGNPTLIAGADSTGVVRTIRTDPSGRADRTPSTILAQGEALTASANVVAAAAGLRLTRVELCEDAGSPATARVVVRRGTGNGDPVICRVPLNADQGMGADFDDLAVAEGVRIQVLAGSVTYSIHGKTV